ncbi:MAG: bifunctional adenosylcobinamide kinase/adenosylcobinamide-phosphate guanylyltransferase [Candidatus Obscuribacterales bacterium]|nr:bifunctional adenosylcobinamide kinase/adenosylcobinamide-phosphate guanylyltransferase [Candidatus Obscuribacterales bacterium]
MNNLTLITGGVRCGKSALAEKLAAEAALPVHYLATMPRIEADLEQQARLERHRRRRPESWHTIECASRLPSAIRELPSGPAVALLDCLSLEVTNVMLLNGGEHNPYGTEDLVIRLVEETIEAIGDRSDISFLVVTNETGWGIVPESALGRAFRDFLGTANQEFARAASRVILVCAGLKLQLKP